MAKRLIVFCDGTWNEPEQFMKRRSVDNDDLTPVTNVVKLMRAVIPQTETHEQVTLYERGLGTEGLWLSKKLGAMTGWGISRNIQDAYRFLAHNFCPQDQIFLFGFSRGAYTARSLASFIDQVGILKPEKMHLLPRAYRKYMRSERPAEDPEWQEFLKVLLGINEEENIPDKRELPIRFIGVWDSVGALGAPGLLRPLTTKYVKFHNTALPVNVTTACQALALHELRRDFQPVFWSKKTRDQQIIQQVWFAGAHGDIGGGYPEHALSDIALMWMAARA